MDESFSGMPRAVELPVLPEFGPLQSSPSRCCCCRATVSRLTIGFSKVPVLVVLVVVVPLARFTCWMKQTVAAAASGERCVVAAAPAMPLPN